MISNNMTMYHKVWGEVKVVDYDEQFITINLGNQETKKLLLSSIGTHLFYTLDEMNELNQINPHNQTKKAEDYRKHYHELGIDEYSNAIETYEDLDWSAISKTSPDLNEDQDILESDEDYKGEDLLDYFNEEVI